MQPATSHLEILLAERAEIAASIADFGLVRERPLVKGGETIANDLVANPLLQHLRAIDEQIIKLMSTEDAEPVGDRLAEFETRS